jgi:Rrf2 family iron-sulfur cluster assembly transcriptional regulator
MGLSRRSLIALETLVDIALNAGAQPVSAADLAQRMELSKRAIEPVLQVLVKAGFLVSTRGPAGGYELGIERTRLTVLDIAARVDGELGQDELPASRLAREVVIPLAERVAEAERSILGRLTLADLKAEAERKGLGSRIRAPIDYSI